MSHTKTLYFIGSILLFSSCASNKPVKSKNGYSYHGFYFGEHITSKAKKGIRDGCLTAKGRYKKSHYLFNNNDDYHNAWFLGRNKCRKLLKINKNGDLIL